MTTRRCESLADSVHTCARRIGWRSATATATGSGRTALAVSSGSISKLRNDPGGVRAGHSTRCSRRLGQGARHGGISKSQVSRLPGDIEELCALPRAADPGLPGRVGERGPNSAPTGQWPYLSIDATYVEVREAGRTVSVAVTIAIAVNSNGRREVLGMAIGAFEAETFWVEFLRQFKCARRAQPAVLAFQR
jgi:Transposase, Mutator family